VIDIRRFEQRNLKRVLEVERDSFGRDAWPGEAFLEYWRESPELFLIARLGRNLAGYSIARTTWRGAELDSIAVDPRYRGRGIAQALLAATQARVGSRTLRLMVETDNTDALRFYRQSGFVRTRLVRHYYGRGRDAWRMQLRATPILRARPATQ
jgi:ribosomal-protein-alanine N-acetyltransferase